MTNTLTPFDYADISNATMVAARIDEVNLSQTEVQNSRGQIRASRQESAHDPPSTPRRAAREAGVVPPPVRCRRAASPRRRHPHHLLRVVVDAPHYRKDHAMNPVLTPPISSYRCSSHLSRASCVKCGARPSAPDVAELIETDELCPDCRAANLYDSATEIFTAIADLARDALPAMSRGLLPVEVEQLVVAYATAALLATTPAPAGAALLAELGLAVA